MFSDLLRILEHDEKLPNFIILMIERTVSGYRPLWQIWPRFQDCALKGNLNGISFSWWHFPPMFSNEGEWIGLSRLGLLCWWSDEKIPWVELQVLSLALHLAAVVSLWHFQVTLLLVHTSLTCNKLHVISEFIVSFAGAVASFYNLVPQWYK